MRIHIIVTHPDLVAHGRHVADALQRNGDDVSVADGASDGEHAVAHVRHADALVCLVDAIDALRRDGTAPGEHETEIAAELGIPVTAYEPAARPAPSRPADARAGYGVARLEQFRRHLHDRRAMRAFDDPEDLASRVLEDVERTRARLRRDAPDVFRSIHRRLRTHPNPAFDAFTITMHNMDELYVGDQIVLNREVPAALLGRTPGGAGANAIVALGRLGQTTGVAGAVGDDANGRTLRADLERNQVDTDLLLTVDDVESGRSIVLRDGHGNNVSIVFGGANDRLVAELERRDLRQAVSDAVTRSRIVHCSSFSAMSERNLLEALLDGLPAEAVVTFKPGTMHAVLGADRLAPILERCDVLFVSGQALDMLLQHTQEFRPDVALGEKLGALFAWRQRRGHTTPMVVVVIGETDDRAGPVYISWGTDHYDGGVGSDGPRGGTGAGRVQDPTGVRDATVAGVLYGLLRGRAPVDCANLADVLSKEVAAEYGCRRGLPRSAAVRDVWRRWMQVHEPPGWLDPYG